MELTRRDALVAAAGGGAGLSGGAVLATVRSESTDDRSVSISDRSPRPVPEAASEATEETNAVLSGTFVAVARAIYPSTVSRVEAFVRAYLENRTTGSVGRREGLQETVQDLDGLARGWYGASITSLDPGTIEALLSEIGVRGAEADRQGTISQRVRYHVVNELQYALFASPTGGRLVGIENPIGHPGGIESYRQGPSA